MKKTKFIVISLLFCVLLTILLTGCSNGNKPSKNQILKDLKESFAEQVQEKFDSPITIKKYEIELSESEEKEYTATLTVECESKYSDFYWKVDVNYSKYDQGWKLKDCRWGDYSYKQVRYPNKFEIENMVSAKNIVDMDRTEILYEEETIIYQGQIEANWSKYAIGKSTISLIWKYDLFGDKWNFRETDNENGTFEFKKSLDGKWDLYFEDNGYVIVKNLTETGCDIAYEMDIGYGTNCSLPLTHFEFSGCGISWREDGILIVTFSKDNVDFKANGKETYGDAELSITFPRNSSKETFYSDIYFTITIDNNSGNGLRRYGSFAVSKID